MKQLAVALALSCTVLFGVTAQNASFFQPVNESDIRLEKGMMRSIVPKQYKTYQLDYQAIKTTLQSAPQEFTAAAEAGACVIQVPLADGTTEPYAVWEIAMMEPALAANFPYIHTYAGRSQRNLSQTIRFSVTARGFRAMVMQPDMGVVYVEPYSWNQDRYYMVYDRKDLPNSPNMNLERQWIPSDAQSAQLPVDEKPFAPGFAAQEREVDPVKLKIYRFVVATTGEFALDHGGTKPLVFSAVVEYTNMVSATFERDIDLRLQLINASQNVVFLDPNSDPYTGDMVTDWMGQNPAIVNMYCNVNSHDVGHVYARYITGGAIGVAGGITCSDGKARGCSAGNGNGDYGDFFLNVVGQEVGHQMSGGHTWNRCNGGGGRAGNTAFEPGSGSTIMSYAGACGPDNIQGNSDLYYHSGSIEEIQNFYKYNSGTSCGSFATTTNLPPTVTLPYPQSVMFIPISTPFELNGTGTDPDNDPLVYNWEEIDAGPETPLGAPMENAATFRTWPAVDVSNRYFPKLSIILNNTSSFAEQLPTYTRDLTFRLAARDNRPNGGGVAWADVEMKAWGAAGPFTVTSPNASAAVWHIGEYANVTWDVANTNLSPVNCQRVNIRLSTDGGLTYPITLAQNVVNDGSQYVLVPNITTGTARVRVDAVDNVFFDISNSNFKIQEATQPALSFGLSVDVAKICLPDQFTSDVLISGVGGFNSPVNLSAGNLPAGLHVSFSATTVNPGDPCTLTLDLTNYNQAGVVTFNVQAVVVGTTDTILRPVTLTLFRNDFSTFGLTLPADGSTGLDLVQTIHWNTAQDAVTYDLQVSKSPAFVVMIASKTDAAIDSFKIPQLLSKGTAYYWRVRPRNECGIHDWSEPYFFSTYAENCGIFKANDLPKAISASSTPTIESKISINAGGTISDLNVSTVAGYHAYFEDLEAHLISPQGTDLILFKNKCVNYNGVFNFTLDDNAPATFKCPPPTNGSPMKPQNPLSIFNGENSTGIWILRIKDNVIGSGGTIDSVKLEFCASATIQPPFLINNNILHLQTGTNEAIVPDLLLAGDPNNTHAQLVFTLVTIPKFGLLMRNGVALNAGDTFTQTDIDNGALRYFDFGTTVIQDDFRFVITDGEGGFLATPRFIIRNSSVGTSSPAESLYNFSIFPNPASDAVWIALDYAVSAETRVSLTDISGKTVLIAILPTGAERMSLPVGNLPKGIYAVRLEGEHGVAVRKLILQ